MQKREENLQIAVCNYLRYQYPNVEFMCDLASGMKLTMGQAVKAQRMRSTKGWPDLFIAAPSGAYHGLFIELKREGERLKKKDGSWASEHIEWQNTIHEKLLRTGYMACFAVGFDEAKKVIDDYFSK